MKKSLTAAGIIILLLTLVVMPAFAGSHHGRSGSTARFSVCGTKNCAMTGLHVHGSQYYNTHFYGDGNNYHNSHGKGHH